MEINGRTNGRSRLRLATIAAFVLGLLSAASPVARAGDALAYQAATALARATFANTQSGGIPAVKSHAADIERALIGGREIIDDAAAHGTILTDGGGESLGAMEIASKDGKSVVAVPNPYPFLALYLGSYYNEVGRPEDALRVLTLGLSLFVRGGNPPLGRHWAALMSERGVALDALKRFDEALAGYDELLRQPNVDERTRALIYRGRGFALTEIGRLADAEAAYQKSLEIEPGNARALRELSYIRSLKAGGQRAPGVVAPLQPHASQQEEEKPSY